MHFFSRIILIMGNVFLKCLDLPSKIATLPKWMVFGYIFAEMINVTYSQKNCTLLMTSGIFWNLEIGNREIWKIPEIGWFGPILTFWVYFPLV